MLEVGKIKPKLKPMSDRQWKKLKDIFMPAAKSQLMTIESFLNEIPNFDVEAELKRMEKQADEIAASIDLDEVEEIESEE